ncbi:UNVERIFIED_ORG: hypothetical protein ABIB52_003392 [Arthrobacter sp. UYCu721]
MTSKAIQQPYNPKWNVALRGNAASNPGWGVLRHSPIRGWNVDRTAYADEYAVPGIGQYHEVLGMNVALPDPNFSRFTGLPNDNPYPRWFPQIVSQGIRWMRITFPWNQIESNAPIGDVHIYNWKVRFTDDIMTAASLSGAKVLAIPSGTPAWAQLAGSETPNPAYNSAYAAYCVAILSRYGPAGSFWAANPGLVPAPINALELWNEPYQSGGWGGSVVSPSTAPADYAALAREAISAIRASAYSGTLLGLSTEANTYDAPTKTSYHMRLMQADTPLFELVDFLSVHPYVGIAHGVAGPRDCGGGMEQCFYRVGVIQSSFPNLPIWLTEFGFTNGIGVDSAGNSDSFALMQSTAATYMQQMLDLAFQHFHVAKCFPYSYAMPGCYDSAGRPQPNLYNPDTNTGGGALNREKNFGLMAYGYDSSGSTLNWFSLNPTMKAEWAQILRYAG